MGLEKMYLFSVSRNSYGLCTDPYATLFSESNPLHSLMPLSHSFITIHPF